MIARCAEDQLREPPWLADFYLGSNQGHPRYRNVETLGIVRDMVDDSVTPPPPPPADSSVPPPTPPPNPPASPSSSLRRSRNDKVIAGVCGGIGNRFDIDPVVVRIAWVLLTILGGSGLILYLIAWIVMAKEGEAESAVVATFRGGDGRTVRGLLAIGVVLLLVLMLGGSFGWAGGSFGWFFGWGVGGGLFLPLLLVAAGVALLVWPEPARREVIRSWLPPVPSRGGSSPTAAAEGEDDDSPRPFLPPLPGVQGLPDLPEHSGSFSPSPPKQRRRPFLGPLTLALLLVLTGSAVALERTDVISVDPAVFLALCLTVVGVTLTLSAFIGRARGLIVLGVLLLPVVWGVHAVDLTWWDGIGDEEYIVSTVDDLESEYHHGIGQLIVDLTGLDLEGTTQEIAVGLTIGEVVVLIPEGMHVEIDADGRIGQVRLERRGPGLSDEGFDLSLDTTTGDPAGGTLVLDLDIGIGSARVEVP